MPGVWDLKGSLPALQERFKDAPLRMVVVDTLAAFFDGDNENDNAQQQEFATRVLRPLTELPGRPTVVVPAHPTKGAGKDALTPKGGSSLLNAVDGNLSAWNTDGTVKVHWQGKFRGAPWKSNARECRLRFPLQGTGLSLALSHYCQGSRLAQ